MAIAQMAKVLIVSHCSQASDLLEALQSEGICQVLNAQEAAVSKDFPDLVAAVQRPKDIEQLLDSLAKCIAFLKSYDKAQKGFAGILSPRAVVAQNAYYNVVRDEQIFDIIEHCRRCEASMDKLNTECESLAATLETLKPWSSLETPVEEIGQLKQAACFAGLIPAQHLEQVRQQLADLGAAVEVIGASANKNACLIVCLNENLSDTQKLLRSADFETVNFHPMTGTAAKLLTEYNGKLNRSKKQLQAHHDEAASLSKNILKLQILHDHYENLLKREQAKDTAPATEQTVILEGWVKENNYSRLEKLVSKFPASSLGRIAPAEGEDIPVEIENKNYVRPFEMVTRLYGMPVSSGIDPTVCLAPFFMLFFGICLADVGYGIVMAALMAWLIKKTQGDKKPLWMFLICAAITIAVGAVTGSWFGDAVPTFLPFLNPLREKLMLFDPLGDPTVLFKLSVILGYIQIMTGLTIAFVHNLRQKSYIAAVCDNLTWLVMLNSIVIFGLGKAGMVSPRLGRSCGLLALVPAAIILLFSHRQGRWAGRIGMGAYNLFSTVFYLGDVLSYLRLAALCMVSSGIAMAINIIAKICLEMPYGIGILAMILVLVFGHALNLVLSALSAFVHSLRLQYVEFFTKFFVGGGRLFEPLRKDYKHIYIK